MELLLEKPAASVLAAVLVCPTWAILPALAVDITAAANLPAIRNAIITATDGDTIVIEPGEIDFGTEFLVLNKMGVSLKGADQGRTVFKTDVDTVNNVIPSNSPASCYANGGGTPLLALCLGNGGQLPNSFAPTVIENIVFKNTASNPTSSPYKGAQKGIGLIWPGPSPDNPSIIMNCEFIDMWRNGATGIGIEFVNKAPRPSNWRVEGCKFDGCKSGVYINANSQITIKDNTFTR